MVEIGAYLMKKIRDRDKEKHPLVNPEIMTYFSRPSQRSKPKLINSVIICPG